MHKICDRTNDVNNRQLKDVAEEATSKDAWNAFVFCRAVTSVLLNLMLFPDVLGAGACFLSLLIYKPGRCAVMTNYDMTLSCHIVVA